MADKESVVWKGASGRSYTYYVYAMPAGLNDGQDGNYVYAKRLDGRWQPIYIGQGDLGERTDINAHHQSRCLKTKGATHVHARKNGGEADRLAEERDLLKAYPEAYQPIGCNEKPGG